MVLSCSLSWEVIIEIKRAPLWAPREWFVAVRLLRQPHASRARLGKTSERLGVADGDVREHLAVELDARQAQAVHELAVAHALLRAAALMRVIQRRRKSRFLLRRSR